jgi:Uma2 family endonuclease
MALHHTGDHGFTWADLRDTPEDGVRRELVHGQLLVTAAPRLSHQRTVLALCRVLGASCPQEYEVVVAPYDWYIDDHTVFEPDVLVVERRPEDREYEDRAPLLVVEVLSVSTASTDLLLKRHEYAQGGAPHYLIVDPRVPSITALRSEGGEYREVRSAVGEETLELAEPWPLAVRPADLVTV